jgi:hypothetical protein
MSSDYFNYFTEVEEHFQKARGTALFLLSPLDWALIEDWKNSGIPLEAVLRGIDAAFDKWQSRKNKTQRVNSLAYCAQAVLKEAQAMAQNLPSPSAAAKPESPFPIDAVRAHLIKSAATLRLSEGFDDIAASVDSLLANLDQHFADLADLDLRLTALEDKMAAIARTRLTDAGLLEMRRSLDHQMTPYRSRMTADQLVRLEQSLLNRAVYERLSLPRLSLFYLQ